MRSAIAAIAVLAALGFAACGDDDENEAASKAEDAAEETRDAVEDQVNEAAEEIDGEIEGEPSSNGESADLPSCDEGVYPCRKDDGSVTSGPPPEGGGAEYNGETADLPE